MAGTYWVSYCRVDIRSDSYQRRSRRTEKSHQRYSSVPAGGSGRSRWAQQELQLQAKLSIYPGISLCMLIWVCVEIALVTISPAALSRFICLLGLLQFNWTTLEVQGWSTTIHLALLHATNHWREQQGSTKDPNFNKDCSELFEKEAEQGNLAPPGQIWRSTFNSPSQHGQC